MSFTPAAVSWLLPANRQQRFVVVCARHSRLYRQTTQVDRSLSSAVSEIQTSTRRVTTLTVAMQWTPIGWVTLSHRISAVSGSKVTEVGQLLGGTL